MLFQPRAFSIFPLPSFSSSHGSPATQPPLRRLHSGSPLRYDLAGASLCGTRAATPLRKGENAFYKPKTNNPVAKGAPNMQRHATKPAPDVPKWSALLVEAVNKPGLIMEAYSAFHNYSIGNQILALVQCQLRGLEPGPINTFPGWQALGRTVKRGERVCRNKLAQKCVQVY